MNKLFKLIIILLVVVFVAVLGYGLYYKSNAVVDDTVYVSSAEDENTFNYEEIEDFEYIEEKVEFPDDIQTIIDNMTLEEKVAQLFIVTPEQLEDTTDYYVLNADDDTNNAISKYQVGGIVYSINNMQNIDQLSSLVIEENNLSKDINGIPLFLAIEETNESFYDLSSMYYEYLSSPYEMSQDSDESIYTVFIENRINELKEIGFNSLFKISCNIAYEDEDGEIVDNRSFSKDGISASEYMSNTIDELNSNNIISMISYFPTNNDNERDFNTLLLEDLLIAQGAIDTNVKMIQLSNDYCAAITNNDSKVYESENTIDILRARMGYDGIVVSPDLEELSSDEIIQAYKAGVDMFYKPNNLQEAIDTLVNAINDGNIDEVHLNNAVGRILLAKENIE